MRSPAVDFGRECHILQRLWEVKLDWDDPIPEHIHGVWSQWRRELPLLMTIHIPRCYSPSREAIVSTQLHGFSDASEEAYAGVVYTRIRYSSGRVDTSLIISKTKVSPIKRLYIPRLELCGAQILARLLCHTMKILKIPVRSIFAWTDSTVALGPVFVLHSYMDHCMDVAIYKECSPEFHQREWFSSHSHRVDHRRKLLDFCRSERVLL